MAGLNFPIEAFLEAVKQKERNRQMAMQSAMGIGENLGGAITSAADAINKQRAKEQLLYAMKQPQELPMQGPLQPTEPAIQGPRGYVPPSGGADMVPAGQFSPSAMPENPMMPNPAADVMGPLQQLYPDIMEKSLAARYDPLTQSQIFKNLQTGKEGGGVMFTPEQAAFNVGDPALKDEYARLYGPKVPGQAVTARGQAAGRAGVERRFGETMDDRQTNRQLRIDKWISDVGLRVDNHPVIKKLNEQGLGLRQVDDLLELVKAGNTVASAALGVKMAKAMGETGVMTDPDVVRYIQSAKFTQKTRDILKKWTQGIPSEATLEEIGQIADALKYGMDKKMQPFFDRQINIMSRSTGLSAEDAAYRLDLPYSGLTGKKVAQELNAPKGADPLGIRG